MSYDTLNLQSVYFSRRGNLVRLLTISLSTFWVPCLLSILSGAVLAAPPGFVWREYSGERLLLQEHGKDVLAFQLRPKSLDGKFPRASYVHPLIGPQGMIWTEDFPEDHLHHRGIFWAWHQLLLDGQPVADPWMCEGLQWSASDRSGAWIETSASGQSAAMEVTYDWVVADPNRKDRMLRLVRETAGIKVWPSKAAQRVVDFDLRFRALRPGVSLGGSDDAKGYGGFSPRIRLADDVRFFGQHGETTPQPLAAVDAGAWVDVVGTLDGKRQGVAIMVHPSHPDFPVKWILRPKRSMQNPQWPGREAMTLDPQHEVRLRYRLVLHVGDLAHDELEAIWQDFAKST